MEESMKSRPFSIKPDMSGQSLEPISPDENKTEEKWLQKLLFDHPQILPVDEIEQVFWPLIPIGREIRTNVGSIDNLFISKSGYLVLVETKLWRNSQAKREVFAQAIDYASELSKWSFEQLEEETRKHAHKGLIELIQDISDSDADELPTEETIAQNLRLGRFLILVVSDHIHNSLIEMLKFVNRYPHLATNVGLIELQCYLTPGHPDEIIVVPSIVAKTVILERSIVQVNIVPEMKHEIKVEQVRTEPGEESGVLSEDAFWKLLKQKSPASELCAQKIINYFKEYPEIIMKMRKSAMVARMSLPESDQRLSLFFISTDGRLTCWPSTIAVQLANAGLDQELGKQYESELSKFLKQRSSGLAIYYPVDKVPFDTFKSIVDKFIKSVLGSEAATENS
jgi:hypothetical protein